MKIFFVANLLVVLLSLHLVNAQPDHDGDHDDDDDDDDDHDLDDDDGPYLCPDGFWFAGIDTSLRSKPEDEWGNEINRTPVYSCYQVFNSQETWVSASLKCHDSKSRLASFEDIKEIQRFRSQFKKQNRILELDNQKFLTSAIHFGPIPEDGWMWAGSNATINVDDLLNLDANDDFEDLSNQCLLLQLNPRNKNESFLEPIKCNVKHKGFICEARVQTVTYWSWFMANWFTFLLIFLLIVLVLSLCISMTLLNKKRRPATNQRRQRRPVEDLPPSYGDLADQPQQAGRIDYYRQRGRELLARVHIYRDSHPGKAPLPR